MNGNLIRLSPLSKLFIDTTSSGIELLCKTFFIRRRKNGHHQSRHRKINVVDLRVANFSIIRAFARASPNLITPTMFPFALRANQHAKWFSERTKLRFCNECIWKMRYHWRTSGDFFNQYFLNSVLSNQNGLLIFLIFLTS